VWGEPVSLTAGILEDLAIREHNRWCAYMRDEGWKYSPSRDDVQLRHPDLAEWESMSEATREKNRDSVRRLPELLADAGFRIVRVRAADPAVPRPRRAGDDQDLTALPG
jgi:hypothetical protein